MIPENCLCRGVRSSEGNCGDWQTLAKHADDVGSILILISVRGSIRVHTAQVVRSRRVLCLPSAVKKGLDTAWRQATPLMVSNCASAAGKALISMI